MNGQCILDMTKSCKIYQFNVSIVIMGDLNCGLFKTHNNKLIDTMDLYILRNIIVKPKRVADHSNTLLDLLSSK